MNRLRKLFLPALLALMLAVPGIASAASIETHSVPAQGHLGVDVHALGGGYYKWNSLSYRLHACHPGGAAGTDCHWELWGRISPSYSGECPAHEMERPHGTALTFFRHGGGSIDPTLSLGSGRVALPPGWGSDHRQLICWYIQVLGSENLSLTAQTVIHH